MTIGAAPEGFRSGFATIVGRPNVGKSTLLNQLLHSKVAITSPRPQTTRNAIRGVLTTPRSQVVIVDTPGLHKPQTLLGERLNAVVRRTLAEVDAVVLLLDASQPIGRGDAFVASELGALTTPVIVALNKVDLVDDARQRARLEQAARIGPFGAALPVSARTGFGVDELRERVASAMPEGPIYYPPGMTTDQPERVLVAELVREKVLELTREEVPHSIAVVVDEIEAREDGDVVDIHVTIYVERDSQKGIVIGRRGAVLKQVGTRARHDIEALLGSRVFLEIRVKVERDWQRRRALIDRFGYAT